MQFNSIRLDHAEARTDRRRLRWVKSCLIPFVRSQRPESDHHPTAALVLYTSACSASSNASSTPIPGYRTVLQAWCGQAKVARPEGFWSAGTPVRLLQPNGYRQISLSFNGGFWPTSLPCSKPLASGCSLLAETCSDAFVLRGDQILYPLWLK